MKTKNLFSYWVCFAVFFIPVFLSAELFKSKEEFKHFVEQKRHFSFDIDRDKNRFPDTWFLQTGPDFQTYHSLLIDLNEGYQDKSSLRVVFSGGKTGIYTAPLKLDPRFAYNIHLYFKGKNLGSKFNNELEFGLKSFNKNQKLIKTYSKIHKTFNENWIESHMLRVEKLPDHSDSCILFVNLNGRPSGRSLLWLDDIQIQTSPRIIFDTKRNLNIFAKGEPIIYSQRIEGTTPKKVYSFISTVKDFLGNTIKTFNREIQGQISPIVLKYQLPIQNEVSGVYYVQSSLKNDDITLIERTEIVARNTDRKSDKSSELGVVVGSPKAPFDRLLDSLNLLGTPVSTIDLLQKPFSFSNYSTNHGLVHLNELLLEKAPDHGYQFIGVLNAIPTEAKNHQKFEVNPPEHLIETFPTHTTSWIQLLDSILFKYGNILNAWQIGDSRTPISLKQFESGNLVLDFIRKKADWMDILLPTQPNEIVPAPTLKNIYIPNTTTLNELKSQLEKQKEDIIATVQLDSLLATPKPIIISKLVKKITILKTYPKVKRIFIDRLTDPEFGLMTRNYKPQSSYFAVKTLIHWLQNAQFLGSIQVQDKSIVNYVFQKNEFAYSIIWRNSRSANSTFYLGKKLQLMDLMGNQSNLNVTEDHSATLPIGPIPIFLITPYPNLWKSILSFKLLEKNIQAKVKLQKQRFNMVNHFNDLGKFDLDIRYPLDWTVEKNIFSQEINSKNSLSHQISLSPSSLSPLDKKIPVTTHLSISLPNIHHHVRIYREDQIHSDITAGMKFYHSKGGLQIDISVSLDKNATRMGSFIASALMPGGESLEVFFKNVLPGEKSIQSSYLPNAKLFIGKTASLTVKENLGNRYISSSFPIQPSF